MRRATKIKKYIKINFTKKQIERERAPLKLYSTTTANSHEAFILTFATTRTKILHRQTCLPLPRTTLFPRSLPSKRRFLLPSDPPAERVFIKRKSSPSSPRRLLKPTTPKRSSRKRKTCCREASTPRSERSSPSAVNRSFSIESKDHVRIDFYFSSNP